MAKTRDPNAAKDGDLQHALEEAAEAATRDPDEAEIAADDAGGTRLVEQMNKGQGTGTIRGKVGAKRRDPNLGSISGTVVGKEKPQQDPNLGSTSGTVAGKRTPPTTTRH